MKTIALVAALALVAAPAFAADAVTATTTTMSKEAPAATTTMTKETTKDGVVTKTDKKVVEPGKASVTATTTMEKK